MRDFLKAARVSRGMTMRDAAEAIGISASHYSMIETGDRDPSGKVAVRLCAVLGVEMELLYAVVHSAGN